jgi:hypothetical protein
MIAVVCQSESFHLAVCNGRHTALVSIKDTWQTNQVNGHSKLGISLDVERLLSCKL